MAIMFSDIDILNYAKEHWYYQDGRVYSKKTKKALGSLDQDGYLRTSYKRWKVSVHRVVYLMHFQEIPAGYILDHINRNRLDNRIENLRVVTPQGNIENKEIPWGVEHKTDKFRSRPYAARLDIRGVKEHLGHFGTACGARMAYLMGRLRVYA